MTSIKITVTKLDAARRQIRTAIRLWFEESDPVSIHTLASAAHEIVHTVFKRKGLSGLLFDTRLIKPEYRSDFANLITSPSNFFKHAQRDPDSEIEFDPILTEMILIIAVYGLANIDGNSGDIENTFMAWMAIHKPNLFTENIYANHFPIDQLQKLRSFNRSEFFEGYQLALRERARTDTRGCTP
jgi:hypothetical protein